LRGMADLLAIASMFFLLLTASALLHLFASLGPLPRRPEELRAEHLYRTLELSQVLPGVSYLRAAAEQLLLEDPTVPENELRPSLEGVLSFLCPENRGVVLELRSENGSWRVEVGGGGRELARRRGSLTLSTPEGLTSVEVEVRLLG